MGAFDTIAEPVACERCGARHDAHAQTKFFDPEFGGFHDRWFLRGAKLGHDLDLAHVRRAALWEMEWLPLRPWSDGPFALVREITDRIWCGCGAVIQPIDHFVFSEGSELTLVESHGWNVLDPAPLRVAHYICGEYIVPPPYGTPYSRGLSAVAAMPVDERIAHIHERLLALAVDLAGSAQGVTLAEVDTCLWCASSWRAWIARDSDGKLFLCGDLDGWRVLHGTLDELVAAVPHPDDFAEAVAALRGT